VPRLERNESPLTNGHPLRERQVRREKQIGHRGIMTE
jgi:hypothetical protein